MKHLLHSLALLMLIISCGKEKDLSKKPVQPAKPPKVETPVVTESANTFFSATPLEQLPKGQNAIYGASMLLTWQEAKNYFGGTVSVGRQYPLLYNLNSTDLYKNTLKKDEYKSSIDYKDNTLIFSVSFDKKLPFTYPLESFKNGLEFNGQKVDAFGSRTFPYPEKYIFSILYYKSDSDFILKLNPDDNEHEIILCMLPEKGTTLKQMFDSIAARKELGLAEMKNINRLWKYDFDAEEKDEVLIPKINFDLKTEYEQLKGNVFSAGSKTTSITKASQRSLFRLDEAGAAVLDRSEIAVPAAAIPPSEEKPHPKKLHFNKPFLILLRRADSGNPYFAVWVENAELLVKGTP